jgi:hypothetical protein
MVKSKEVKAVLTQAEKDVKQAKAMEGTEAGAIWGEIKDKSIEMFALPNQVVSMHVHPVFVDPGKLYLTLNSTATLPSLEVAIGSKYTVELADKFCIVARAVAPLSAKR